MIYDYENTVSKIAEFCSIDKHSFKGEHFKPYRSANNTQLFKRFSGFEKDIELISRELQEYLFPFEAYPPVKSVGGMFHIDKYKK